MNLSHTKKWCHLFGPPCRKCENFRVRYLFMYATGNIIETHGRKM